MRPHRVPVLADGKPVTVTDSSGKQYTNVYYGRGYVQLTWKTNYKAMSPVTGKDLRAALDALPDLRRDRLRQVLSPDVLVLDRHHRVDHPPVAGRDRTELEVVWSLVQVSYAWVTDESP